jgi:hypothetical protein
MVSSIALYFFIDCVKNYGCNKYALVMYTLAMGALATYLYLYDKPHLYTDYHCLIHFLSITGILFYIKARAECS